MCGEWCAVRGARCVDLTGPDHCNSVAADTVKLNPFSLFPQGRGSNLPCGTVSAFDLQDHHESDSDDKESRLSSPETYIVNNRRRMVTRGRRAYSYTGKTTIFSFFFSALYSARLPCRVLRPPSLCRYINTHTHPPSNPPRCVGGKKSPL